LVIAGFGITAHRLASANRLREIDEALQADVAQLAVALPPPSDERTPTRTATRPPPPPREGATSTAATLPAGHYYVLWRPDGREQSRSSDAPADLMRPAPLDGQNYALRTRGDQREFYRFTGAGRCFLVGRSITAEMAAVRRLAWYLAAAGAGVLVIGLLGGWWLATRAIRPIEQISATAEKISAGDLAQRIPGNDTSNELGRLAGVLNSTFSRLEAAFTQQARFTADAAHELRTPVSVILTHAQNGLASEGLTEEPREAFEACQRAAQRMRRLLESLLELARLDAGQERMKHQPFDLAEVAREMVELVEPLAKAKSITIHTELSPTPTTGDAVRIAQVITNLLTNAIEHNHEGGDLRVSTQAAADAARFTVADTGPGIAAADLPHVFERFYRADTARSGTQPNAGLGLAIAKAIVDAHGGRLEVTSSPCEGARFIMTLPAGESRTSVKSMIAV
jgi:two-component system OmpR family sensor kinase